MKRRVGFLLRMQKQLTWARFTILCLFSVIGFTANSQNYFNKLYDYNGNNLSNAASTVVELSNGDFLIGGNKFLPSFGALHFIRINSSGDTILEKRFPKMNCAYTTGASGSLIKCYDGNLVQAGVYIDSSTIYWDALLVKLTQNGDTIWTKTFGGANYDIANIVCQTPDSGFVLMGSTESFNNGSNSDFYLVKTDKNGVLLWQHTFGTGLMEECFSGQITLDGGFIMSGYRGTALHIVKTDGNGVFKWEKVYGGTTGQGFIKQLADSTYILVGAKIVTGLAGQAYMAKLTKAGVIIWEKTYGDVGDQQFYSVPIILNDGSIVCSGVSTPGNIPLGLLVKTDSSGNQQWLRTYFANPSIDNYVYDVKYTSDNGFILVGTGFAASQDAWVVKVDSNGCEYAGCSVGIEELGANNDEIEVYPNPATNEIMLATNQQLKTIHIYNVLGEMVLELERIATSEKAIDISMWKAGVYFIEIETEKGVVRKKLVKE